MNSIRYVTLDPTGNLTCLVLDPVPEENRAAVTAALMSRCEQVGYLQETNAPRAKARLQMMGGEFCGNASMATAAWLAREDGAAGETVVPLEVSGIGEVLDCRVRPLPDGCWEGTVAMPPVLAVREETVQGRKAALVRLEGIVHLILENQPMEKAEAEAFLRCFAGTVQEPAAGLLLWDSERRFMKPLVLVKESGTLVWETGCGSGTTAVGAWLALRRADGVTRSAISQPGGTILAEAEAADGQIRSVRITGRVRIGKTEQLTL